MNIRETDLTGAWVQPGFERLEIVRSAERFAAIEPAWTRLWRRAEGLIFQSHDWISAWWTHAADKHRRGLLIALAWNGDELVGVLPLATHRSRGLRMLEWAAKDHTDYCDALLAPDCPDGLLQRLWDHLSDAGGFDLVLLNRMLPDAQARRLLDVRGRVLLATNHRSEVSVRISGSWADGAAWFDEQSKKTRQNYRRATKHLTELGETKFRLVPLDEDLSPHLERLAALKRKWLARNSLQSDLFDEESSTLAALVDVLKAAGLLRVFVLECKGVVIAISINFVQAGAMMAFVTTYDPDFERGSPGMVLMMDYIQWSIDNGLTCVDFLCGAEAFKQRFATHSVTLASGMGTRTLPGAVMLFADRARYSFRQARLRLASQSQDATADA